MRCAEDSTRLCRLETIVLPEVAEILAAALRQESLLVCRSLVRDARQRVLEEVRD